MSARRHFLLAGQPGWRAATLTRVTAAPRQHLELVRRMGAGHPLVDTNGSLGGLALPEALASDRDGRIYVLDSAACVVKRFDPCLGQFEVLPCLGGQGAAPRQFDQPHGLAVSECGDLYVVDTGNRRVQVFALKGLPLRRLLGPFEVIDGPAPVRVQPIRPADTWPAGVWEPWDAVVTRRRILVSDRASGLIHVFDRHGAWQTAFDGAGPGVPPLSLPTRLAVDRCGRIYVVQEGADHVRVLDPRGGFLEEVRLREELDGTAFCPVAVVVDAAGLLYIQDAQSNLIYRFCAGSGRVFTCLGSGPGGQGDAIVFDRSGNLIHLDQPSGALIRIPAEAVYEADGVYISDALDSGIYQCEWDRLRLGLKLPAGTQVRVDTLTSEVGKTAAEVRGLPEERWETGQLDADGSLEDWDCTILSEAGRFLWLRLTLLSAGVETPSIEQARVYFPRASSLQFVPAVYSEDPISRDFLGRFLSIFDSIRDGIADELDDAPALLDAGSAPAEPATPGGPDFLGWLASWIGLTLDRHWPVKRRRRLLAQAHRLYALRGTPEGLRLHIELYTGVRPGIIEHFKLRRWLLLGEARLGNCATVWGPEVMRRLQLDEFAPVGGFQLVDTGSPIIDSFDAYAHRFTVFVPMPAGEDEAARNTLARIVEMAKPAHTVPDVRIVQPRLRVGVQCFVGVDSIIGAYPAATQEGTGRLGRDTVLGASPEDASPPTMRIGSRSRIGATSVIN